MCVITHALKMIPKAADHSSEILSTDPSMADTDLQSGAPKITLKPSSSTTWSRFKDPRVVRVSKALGGKDRHSKVCTVRGLRDRRVRLSVPTAIQLYDLQERLGLNQPSKVVDWLLDAAKHEIDELPPLEIPPAMMMTMMGSSTSDQNTTNFHQILNFHEFGQARRGLKVSEKSSGEEMRLGDGERNDWCSRNAQDETRQFQDLENATTNNNGTYNSIFRLDASGLTLSQASRVGQHDENWHNFGLLPLQVPNLTNSLPSGVLVYHQPGVMSTQPYFPSGIGATSGDFHDPKEVNYHGSQMPAVDSAGQTSVRSIHFNMTANLLPSNDEK